MGGGTITKKYRKIITLFLASLLTIGAFSGCTGAKKTTADYKKRLDITVWNTQGTDFIPGEVAENNVVEDWLVKKTNVRVKHVYGNGGTQWETVLARHIAGDSFPELMACSGGQGPVHFAKVAEVDKIWELTPQMLSKYAPDIWEKVPDEMWERMKIRGKIYGIPYNFPISAESEYAFNLTDKQIERAKTSEPVSVGTDLWIRDDVLKKLYPDAKTWDELVEILNNSDSPIGDIIMDIPLNTKEDIVKLFKDINSLNLTENGKKIYAFGYSSLDCWVPFTQLGAQLGGYVGRNYITTWDTEKEEIVLPLLEDTVKDVAKLQNQLIREGVFDSESLVLSAKQAKEKILNGEYAVAVLSSITHPPDINEELERLGKTFRYRPLYTNVTPKEGFGPVTTKTTWGSSVGILKTVAESDLPQILNWMNVQFTDEWEEVRYWGPEDAELYIENEDGTREFKNDELNKKYIRNEYTNLTKKDFYGLYDNAGMFFMRFMTESKWEPKQFNKSSHSVLVPNGGGRFTSDSKYRTEVKKVPLFNVWDAEYANLETVQEFWSTRSEWEMPFKSTLVAKSDEEFETEWQKAVDNLKSMIDVDKMLSEMTEIAKEMVK